MNFRKIVILAGALFGLLGAPAFASGPVVVELFTSQSCPNSPKGDAILAQIADRPNVIALSYPVSMWDWRGWVDTLAQPAFDQRQTYYTERLQTLSRYTPQMVISGKTVVRADNLADVDAAITDTSLAVADLSLAVNDGTYTAIVSASEPKARLILAIYNPAIITVEVKTGRNAGKSLPYKNVVTQIKQLGVLGAGNQSIAFAAPDLGNGLACVLMVQDASSGAITSAVRCPSPDRK